MLLWDHVAVWLNWSHLIPSMFVFRLQLPLVTTAGLCCCQEREGSPKVHTVLGTALNLFASSFHPLIQGVNRDGWSSTYTVYLLLSISESAIASKLKVRKSCVLVLCFSCRLCCTFCLCSALEDQGSGYKAFYSPQEPQFCKVSVMAFCLFWTPKHHFEVSL